MLRLRNRGLSTYECAFPLQGSHSAGIRTAGINKALAAHAEPGKLSVHFRADPSGLIALEKAEAVFETTEEYTVQVGSTSLRLPEALRLRGKPAFLQVGNMGLRASGVALTAHLCCVRVTVHTGASMVLPFMLLLQCWREPQRYIPMGCWACLV